MTRKIAVILLLIFFTLMGSSFSSPAPLYSFDNGGLYVLTYNDEGGLTNELPVMYEDHDGYGRTDYSPENVLNETNLDVFYYINDQRHIVNTKNLVVTFESSGISEGLYNDNLQLNLSKNDCNENYEGWDDSRGCTWMLGEVYTLAYEVIYNDDNGIYIARTSFSVDIKVEDIKTLSEQLGDSLFNPANIVQSIVRFIGLDFTRLSVNEDYFNSICINNTVNSCGISFDDYTNAAGLFNIFVSVMFGVMMSIGVVLLIFRFAKDFWDLNPNVNTFRFGEIFKRLGQLFLLLAIMMFLDEIMLLTLHLFNLVIVTFYNIVDSNFGKELLAFTNDVTISVDILTADIEFGGGIVNYLIERVVELAIVIIMFVGSIIVLSKVAITLFERIITIMTTIVFSPILLTFYMSSEDKHIAKKYIRKYIASLLSGLVLVVVSIAFLFLTQVFSMITPIFFGEVNNFVEAILTVVVMFMFMIFYAKMITSSGEVAKNMITGG